MLGKGGSYTANSFFPPQFRLIREPTREGVTNVVPEWANLPFGRSLSEELSEELSETALTDTLSEAEKNYTLMYQIEDLLSKVSPPHPRSTLASTYSTLPCSPALDRFL